MTNKTYNTTVSQVQFNLILTGLTIMQTSVKHGNVLAPKMLFSYSYCISLNNMVSLITRSISMGHKEHYNEVAVKIRICGILNSNSPYL